MGDPQYIWAVRIFGGQTPFSLATLGSPTIQYKGVEYLSHVRATHPQIMEFKSQLDSLGLKYDVVGPMGNDQRPVHSNPHPRGDRIEFLTDTCPFCYWSELVSANKMRCIYQSSGKEVRDRLLGSSRASKDLEACPIGESFD